MVVSRQNMSTSRLFKIYQWTKNAQNWLLPATCVLCRRPGFGDKDLCSDCHAALPWMPTACYRCGLPLPKGSPRQVHQCSVTQSPDGNGRNTDALSGLRCGACLSDPPPYQRCLSLFRYAEQAPRLVSLFKYHGQLQQGRLLADLLASKIRHHYAEDELPDLLMPVPLHSRRLRQRGFNQSLELARHLTQRLQIQLVQDCCQRIRHTPPQQGLDAEHRRHNLLHAFRVDARHLPAGCRVALLDDVITTGATLGEISQQLLALGASEVHAWSIARAIKGP